MDKTDKYSSYEQLSCNEREGVDYDIVSKVVSNSRLVIIAIHGGKIEPMTTEIANEIAGDDFSFYSFEGKKVTGNFDLHITSNNFDEPRCMQMISDVKTVISIHGSKEKNKKVIYLGGLDEELKMLLFDVLRVIPDVYVSCDNYSFVATDKENICNRGISSKGIQIEISRAIRDDFECCKIVSMIIKSVLIGQK